jgi:hypothetical protein
VSAVPIDDSHGGTHAERQPLMPTNARQSGLEALRSVLRRHHTGYDVIFDLAKGDNPSKRHAQNEV